MPLTVRGSAFYFGDAVSSDRATLPQFYQQIKNTGSEFQWPFVLREEEVEIRRRVYCDIDDTHFYGIFLSARNAEFQYFVHTENGRVKVEAKSTDGNPPVEMNFFAIRLDSNKGLFSHYLGSYRFQQFLTDLWASYRHFVEMKKAEASEGLDESAAREVKNHFSLNGKRNCSPLFTPGTFEELINRLRSVSEVRMTTYEIDDHSDRSVSNNIKSVHKVYRLNATPADARLKTWVREKRSQAIRLLSSGRTTHTGSVIGEDVYGALLNINFENTMDDYLDFEYDDIGSFEITNIASHPIISEMLTIMSDGILFRPTAQR